MSDSSADYLDQLITDSILDGRIHEGVTVAWAQIHAPEVLHLAVPATSQRWWTEEEDDFLRENLWRLGYTASAEQLGRRVHAVKIRAKRLELIGPTRDPRNITLNKIGGLLGIDPKIVHRWRDSGFIPFRQITADRYISHLTRGEFLDWVLNPDNWVLFKIEKVAHSGLKRLLEQKRDEWGDEWWTTRQVADYYGTDTRMINANRELGRISGRQVKQSDGVWGFWFYRRSWVTEPEVEKLLRSCIGRNRRRKAEGS